jgi:hypothetical protein
MIEQTIAVPPTAPVTGPSRERIVKASGVAILVAIIILFTAVLPAEYGIDPLHTGALLGLNNLSKSNAGAANGAAASPQAAPAATGEEAPVIKGVFVAQPGHYKIDSRELKLEKGEGIEIKYHMQQKAGMVYSWTASKKVLYEFHGEPDTKPAGASEDYFESYQKDDTVGVDQAHGSFTAPTTGIHGWFWENRTDGPITIKLVTAGFYDYIMQNKDYIKTHLPPMDPK